MATDDSDSDAVNGGETGSEPVVSSLGAGPGLGSILATAVALLRGRPSLLVPFAVAGALGAASTVARLASPYPVGLAPFPDRGLVQLSLPLVPRLEPTVEISSAILSGMKPRFLVAFIGWQALLSAATAVAFAWCLWLAAADTNGVVPPLDRVARLVAFVAVVDGVSLGTVVLAGAWTGFGIGLAFVALLLIAPVFVALFVAPAAIVIDGDDLVAAARESLEYAVASPGTILVILVGLGSVGYALTGVSRLASSPVGAVLATVVSVTVAGTVHAVAVAALHSAGPQ
ncbi:hypothetical protein [Natrinema versiforme]|uniref:Uncharacterized protein n=1 Tax=Natrinema versiforme TaxID=88724 RepID=A0A4P8WMA1_9EURY|nr:hypothetical protein [Natrinema versiforme]QCS43383.1 hypothetical protein FEJ81_13840 [Natrinema versiforme]